MICKRSHLMILMKAGSDMDFKNGMKDGCRWVCLFVLEKKRQGKSIKNGFLS